MTPRLALVADIGGTNARFALCDPTAEAPVLLHERSLDNDAFASLQQAARHYLDGLKARPRHAALALACPVDGDEIRLTNRAWSFTREDLRVALGLDSLVLVNDFAAVAHAVPRLAAGERTILHGLGHELRQGPVSVIGPGTGFGVSLLVGDAARGWQVVATEGGHVAFAPLDDEERLLAARLVARHGRASWERLLSGAGLADIDAVLRAPDGPALPVRDPAAVVRGALAGDDRVARRALARFCAILGSVAGDVALLHGARAVVIAGGIVPRILPFIRASAFRERFLDKGRFAAYLETVSVQVVTHPNSGLLGAAVALRDWAHTRRAPARRDGAAPAGPW